MPATDIVVKGAREHNLRDVDVSLPRNKLICFTGVSGSGKSSLAFDTLYAEGQRRYVESLSTFARQFLGEMPKPDVDHISGLSPSISISQKTSGQNPRSTVGTVTEIYDYLRVLYARTGQGHCPQCRRPITAQSREQIIERIMSLEVGTQFLVLAPLIKGQKGEYRDLFVDLLKQGFARARVDGRVVQLTDDLKLDRQMRHQIEVVVDRLTAGSTIRARLAEAVELALRLGSGTLVIASAAESAPSAPPEAEQAAPTSRRKTGGKRTAAELAGDLVLSAHYACTHCGLSFETPSPQLFSFNSPQGMCTQCDGLGEIYGFEVSRLVPDPNLTFKQGCFDLIGAWRDLGRWRRHIYQGVADTMGRLRSFPATTLLETPWNQLPANLQKVWLWGTGEEHITFTWRGGSRSAKYGGRFEGIVPQLLSRYRSTNSRIQQRQLEKYMSVVRCATCGGARLNPQARCVTLTTADLGAEFAERPARSLPEICGLSIVEMLRFLDRLQLDPIGQKVATELLKEICGRLQFLVDVGLDYLTLDRTAPTLSGGESQRIRLAGQIGCGLVGVLYILDEPSIGLHPRDNHKLLATLTQLRDKGNTVVVVEHDEDTIRASDRIVDFGPGPGVRGGYVVAEGTAAAVAKAPQSVTGQYLSGKLKIAVPTERRIVRRVESEAAASKPKRRRKSAPSAIEPQTAAADSSSRLTPHAPSLSPAPQWQVVNRASTDKAPATGVGEFSTPALRIVGATHNNLRNVSVEIPLGAFVCVTGVSGSGKSSLVSDILVEALRRDLNGGIGSPGAHERIEGLEHLDKLIAIDQSPIGRTPRSNPATYIKVFDDIRDLYAKLPEAKTRGYKPGRFSFNVSGGRCEACEGNGSRRLEMDFLADVWVTCPVCEGKRFNRETLQVRFKGVSIAQVLEMDVQQALVHFENIPDVRHKLQTLHDVGLDYLKLGQASPTLSGGEAQRIKLARELVKKSTGRTLYLLDEPTTGLHFADIQMLLKVLHGFVEAGNTVLVIEHNLDVVKTADWLIDLGPEGGARGGQIIGVGTPEVLATNPVSHTGTALAPYLDPRAKPAKPPRPASKAAVEQVRAIRVRGARQHNLKGIDVDIPRDQMTVCCGWSGSGKSSLAMDTIYAEGQRRYVESLSSYARQFVGQMQKPRLDHIDGLSPAIAIEQKHMGHTPRSTVGTVTEIYDYLRVLLARLGKPHCPACDIPIGTQTADEIVDKIMAEPEGTKLYLLAPLEIAVGEQYDTLWDEIRAGGYPRMRVDGETYPVDAPPTIDRRRKHRVEVLIDRVTVKSESRSRIAGSVESALSTGRGVLHIAYPAEDVPEPRWRNEIHSQHFACDQCGRSFEPLTPHSFSFNSPLGWCPACEGLGTQAGANPAALVHDPKLTLAEGAIRLWPALDQRTFAAMLSALSAATDVPVDVPFSQLSARQRRTILHGSGELWIDVPRPAEIAAKSNGRKPSARKATATWFRFQYKGLYPALEEAAKLSPALRTKLDHLVSEVECSTCDGTRLRDDASAVRLHGLTIGDISRLPLGQLVPTIAGWSWTSEEQKIAGDLIREVQARVQFLVDVGLEYLSLGRPAPTLSGGEAQRIRLASQVGSGLCGVLYVLDEPTIGLHPRDNRRLLGALHRLRDLGNTLLVVEHDREVVLSADQLLDFGPGAGEFGGRIVARGTPAQVAKAKDSVTGPYLSGKKGIAVPLNRRILADDAEPPGGGWLEIIGARHNNLRNVSAKIPLGTFTAVTGVSGSGKSSLIEDVLYNALARKLHRASLTAAPHDEIRGVQRVNKVIRVDQQALGSTPTSNPATYTGAFDLIRTLFAQLPEAKLRGYQPRRFSFNAPGGRCEACEGNGQKRIEMHFLPDVWVECDVCRGRRYNPETLAVQFHGQSIADVLEMSCGRAVTLFENIPKIRRILQTLCDVGLEYLTLGQPAPTLSGGEAQRVKLAAELSRPDTGQTLFLLDEPTTGLHFEDVAKLLEVLQRLVDLGNTVVVIEHNLDIIKAADWVIDMGPEAGDQGGLVVAAGTPEQLIAHAADPAASVLLRSHTAEALAPIMAAGPHADRKMFNFQAARAERQGDLDITDVGRTTKMPWETDGRRWHTQDRVGRNGEPCRWDGKILDRVVDRIHELGQFSPTNWNDRGVVEISAQKKSDGWFFHAITGEQWLLKLKFRVAKATFKRENLVERLSLTPLNDLADLPIYGTGSRVRCKNLRGPWQEVQLHVHSWDEIDRPEFWRFLEQAVEGFTRFAERVQQRPEDVMPWKVLGRKWHFSRKGFPPGKRTLWEVELLEELCELLAAAAPSGQFLWNNQQLVHLFVPGWKEPWATIHTKRLEGIDLQLAGPKGRFALGQLTDLAAERALEAGRGSCDYIRLRFRSLDDLERGDLSALLQLHLESLDLSGGKKSDRYADVAL